MEIVESEFLIDDSMIDVDNLLNSVKVKRNLITRECQSLENLRAKKAEERRFQYKRRKFQQLKWKYETLKIMLKAFSDDVMVYYFLYLFDYAVKVENKFLFRIEVEPIEELMLSVRTYNTLKRAQINTLLELIECEEDLEYIRGLGKRGINEIWNAVESRYFSNANI